MREYDTDAWDYLAIAVAEEERLPALGREGWELMAVGGDPRGQRLFLKRRALTFRERVTLEQRDRSYAALGRDLPVEDRSSS